jgi:hypothetical protein
VIVVTDTSVVLNLCCLQQEALLPAIFGAVLAPPSVMAEFQRLARVAPRFSGLTFPAFIQITAITHVAPALVPNQRLHQGERDALSLAVEVNADAMLMDERAGRTAAASLGLQSIGILGVLIQAKSLGFVPSIEPLMDGLQSKALFWITPALRQQVLRIAGE